MAFITAGFFPNIAYIFGVLELKSMLSIGELAYRRPLRYNGVTGCTFMSDSNTIIALVIAKVATHTTYAVEMTYIIGILRPAHFHQREDVLGESLLGRLDCIIDSGAHLVINIGVIELIII